MAQPGVHLRATRECFAMGRLVLDEVEILTVACAAAAQRQGLARQVMVALIEASAVLGAHRQRQSDGSARDPRAKQAC